MSYHFRWILLTLTFVLASCVETRNKPTETVQLPTTDSLGLDVMGLKLGETYSEKGLFDALKSRITDLQPLSERKTKDWQLKTPYFLRLKNPDAYVVCWEKTVELLGIKGIPWERLSLYTTPEGVLYEISLSSSEFNDIRSVDSLFRNTIPPFVQSFGTPVYGRMTTPATKYLSFKTGKIERKNEVTAPPFSATWYDGTRELEIYYFGGFDNSVFLPSSLTIRFEDKSIKTAIMSNGQTTKPTPKGIKSVERWIKNHFL